MVKNFVNVWHCTFRKCKILLSVIKMTFLIMKIFSIFFHYLNKQFSEWYSDTFLWTNARFREISNFSSNKGHYLIYVLMKHFFSLTKVLITAYCEMPPPQTKTVLSYYNLFADEKDVFISLYTKKLDSV